MIERRLPDDPNETVRLIVSLLVRYPELSRISIDSRARSISFFFIVSGRIADADQISFAAAVDRHVDAFHRLDRREGAQITTKMDELDGITIVEVRRDTRTVAREELGVIVALLTEAFGDRVVANPPAEGDDDSSAHEEMVGNAFDALRRGKQKKSLVGFRDDRRVLVCFARDGRTLKADLR